MAYSEEEISQLRGEILQFLVKQLSEAKADGVADKELEPLRVKLQEAAKQSVETALKEAGISGGKITLDDDSVKAIAEQVASAIPKGERETKSNQPTPAMAHAQPGPKVAAELPEEADPVRGEASDGRLDGRTDADAASDKRDENEKPVRAVSKADPSERQHWWTHGFGGGTRKGLGWTLGVTAAILAAAALIALYATRGGDGTWRGDDDAYDVSPTGSSPAADPGAQTQQAGENPEATGTAPAPPDSGTGPDGDNIQ